MAGAVAAFAANLRLSMTNATNSDGSGVALQGWDMLHGNLLLHGWSAADVTFSTTEVPEYALVELVHGLNADAVHIAAALTYTIAMALAALLAAGRTRGREALARGAMAAGIMIAPQLDAGTYILLNSPDHFGTSVPILLAWLIIDRARPRWYVPVAVAIVLAWSETADLIVLYVGAVPLALVCAFRVLRETIRQHQPLASRRYEAALAAAAVLAGVAGMLGPHVLAAIGGETQVAPITQLSPLHLIVTRNLRVTGMSLLLLAGADFIGVHQAVRAGFEMLHLAGAALGACAIVAAAWRFPRDKDIITQLLVAGIAVNLVTFVIGTHASEISFAREIAPVLPLGAALAGRLLAGRLVAGRLLAGRLAGRLLALRLAPVLAVVLCGYLAAMVFEIRQPVVPAQNAEITSWLEAHNLLSGLSGYWAANVVSLTSGDRVVVRSVNPDGDLLVPAAQITKAQWFDPRRASADFVVLYPGYIGTEPFTGFTGLVGFTNTKQVLATFGAPARTYRVGRYTVLVWDKNLLADLRSGR